MHLEEVKLYALPRFLILFVYVFWLRVIGLMMDLVLSVVWCRSHKGEICVVLQTSMEHSNHKGENSLKISSCFGHSRGS